MEKFLIIDIEDYPIDDADKALEPFIENVTTRTKKDLLKAAEEKEQKQRNIIERAALSPLSSRLACIGLGYVTIPDDQDLGTVQNELKLDIIKHKDEFEMIHDFKLIVEKYQHLVTFNGRNFDFPYLMFRAVLHQIPLKLPIYYKNIRDGHFDLAQHMFDLSLIDNLDGTRKFISMSIWNRYFGLQEKEMDARDIKKYIQEGREVEVYDYCLSDIERTYQYLLKFHHHYERRFDR